MTQELATLERNISPSLQSGDETAPNRGGPGPQEAHQLSIFEVIKPTLRLAAFFADDGQVVKSEAAAALGRNPVIETKSPCFDRSATVVTMVPSDIAGNEIAKITEPVIQRLARGLSPAQ